MRKREGEGEREKKREGGGERGIENEFSATIFNYTHLRVRLVSSEATTLNFRQNSSSVPGVACVQT